MKLKLSKGSEKLISLITNSSEGYGDRMWQNCIMHLHIPIVHEDGFQYGTMAYSLYYLSTTLEANFMT